MSRYEPGFPKHMIHPQHMPAVMTSFQHGSATEISGTAERFPAQIAETPMAEADLRARGYLVAGEASPRTEFREYPLMMRHPDHVEKVPAEIHADRDANGVIQRYTIPEQPEKYPDQLVHNPEQEAEWYAKGWRRPGHTDPVAFDKAKEAPGMPGAEWPKWVMQTNPDGTPKLGADGKPEMVLMQDPNTRVETHEFPKMLTIGGKQVIAQDAADEARLLGIPEARGSSKNEPTKRDEPAVDPALWAEFQQFLAFKKMQEKAEPEPDAAHETEADPLGELRTQATELGVDVDRRWGERRLREEIDKALAA